MSLEQRQRFIDGDRVVIDADAVRDTRVLVIDDVRITGFHERRLADVLAGAGVADVTFGYLAMIDGRGDPTVEKRMNEAAVGGLDALSALMTGGGFTLNSRACKLLLAAP